MLAPVPKLELAPRKRLAPIFGTLAAVLCGSALTMAVMERSLEDSTRSLAREEDVLDDLRESLSNLKDAETGARGFVITGNAEFLEPHTKAKELIDADLSTLDRLAKRGTLSQADVGQYRALALAKMADLNRLIQLRKTDGFDAASTTVKTRVGKKLMDELRTLSAHMVQERQAAASSRRASVSRLSRQIVWLALLVMGINLVFLRWAYRRIRMEVSACQEATSDAVRRRDLMRVTLSSIGDGVIVTDPEGRISLLNEMAQQLTGWTQEEAAGKECQAIFHIINESTRALVESPVDKVLRLGTIVGLANHTLLVRKDGMELPIDDSGAPIRDADGVLKGVVLVFRDFSEHKKAETALRLAMEEAQAASVAKDNFLATLSHELRTPLSPVVATLTNWASAPDLPSTWREDVEMMHRNLDLEARLIDDLLDLTRIIRGKLSLNPTLSDVNHLLDGVARMYQSEIHAKRQRLSLDLAAASHHAFVDPARLQQVILNVFKNAAKFTPAGGHIQVVTSNDDDGLLNIRISDSGIGMTQDVLSRIFQPFEQGTDEVMKHYGGLGLGMAISKELMEAQGGSITAESMGTGQGSTFQLALPAITAEESTRGDISGQPPRTPLPPLKLLVVEDHFDTARAMSRLLERWGHSVTIAGDVKQALACCEAQPFDLLLSDIGLPDGTGMDLIKKIREYTQMPAIALSGFGMEDDVSAAMAAGFDAHLTKPINFQKLDLLMHQLLSKSAGAPT